MRKPITLLILLALFAFGLAACVERVDDAEPEAPAADTTTSDSTADSDAEPEPAEPDDLLGEIRSRGTIRVSTDPNYAPQSYLDEDGNFTGFDVAVAEEIAARLGVEVEFVTPDWDLITAGNWGDQWDMSVGSMTVTKARQEVLAFADPAYYYTPAQFAAAADAGINTLDALDGETICVGLSTTYESWLNGEDLGLPEASFYAEPPADVTVLPLQTDNECAQSIQAGRTEFSAFLTSNTVVEAAIAEGVPIVKVGAPVFSENLAVAFDRAASLDNTSLIETVSGIIAAMHADGTLSRLAMEWFGEDLTIDPSTVEAEVVPAPAEPEDLLAAVTERGMIRVSTDPNYAPQSFLDENGNFVGFDVAVAEEIGRRLGVDVEFVTPDWDLITAGNWGDQWDMSVGSMTVTTAREQVLQFASPSYYYTPAQFAAANGSGIASLADIDGETVCVGLSTTYESWLNGEDLGLPEASFFAEPPADVTVLPLQTDNECAQSIQAGRTEFSVFLTSNTVVEAAIAEGVPVYKVGAPVFSENLAVAFDRAASLDPVPLVDRVGEIITAMHADGTLSRLSLEWFEEDLTIDPTTMEPGEPVEEAMIEPDGLYAEILERGVIRVSTDPNYAPQSFLDEDGNFVGFDVAVAAEIASRLGVEIEFVTPDWDLITAGNWGDQWDMSVGSMTVTRARQEVLQFADPAYYYTPAQFAAAADAGITELADIDGQTVCVGLSTTYESWLNGEDLGLPEASFYAETPADVTVLPLQTDNECAQSIQAGRTEFSVFLTSNTVVQAAIAEGVPVVTVGSPVFSENLAVAFDRAASADPASLVAAVGKIITEMHADGTLSALSIEWFGEDLTVDPTQ